MASPVETLPEACPLFPIGAPEIGAIWCMLAGRNGGKQPHFTAQHSRGGGRLAASGTALVIALRAERVLKVIVGPRQIRDSVTVEQSRAVAGGDRAKVPDGIAQTAGTIMVACHGTDQSIEAAPNHDRVLSVMVVQNVRGLMDPLIGTFDVGPQHGGLLQAALDQGPQWHQRRRRPLFLSPAPGSAPLPPSGP